MICHFVFFFHDTATTEMYTYLHTLSLHDALPIWRARPHLGGEMPDDEALYQILNPASHRAMLTRMLRNLHGVYLDLDDWERAVRCADRILRLTPDNAEALRDRGLGYFKLGHRLGARADIARYLDRKSTRLNSSHSCASRMPS